MPEASLLTQVILAEKYGPRLGIEQLAQVLGISKGAIYNQISAGTMAIPTYVDGGKRWADFRDVAAHIDECRRLARVAAHEPLKAPRASGAKARGPTRPPCRAPRPR